MMNEKFKKIAVSISAGALALALGIQTFVFGQTDLQKLQTEVAELTKRLVDIESCCGR
jgi:hypothetical protein